MSQEKDPLAVIVERLKTARKQRYPGKVHVAVSGPNPVNHAFIQPWPRLDIILDGRKAVTLALRDGIREVHLNPGDAFYAVPGSWESHRWDSCCQMLCIVPRLHYLRVSFYDQTNPDGHQPEPAFFHTSHPYSETYRHVVDALNASATIAGSDAPALLAQTLVALSLSELSETRTTAGGKAERTFQQICQWLENVPQQDIDRETAARIFRISPSYLSQLFNRMTGHGFHQYLTRLRLTRAKRLLKTTDLPVYQVADQCGFNNHVHFVRRFRELEGLPPGKFRDRN